MGHSLRITHLDRFRFERSRKCVHDNKTKKNHNILLHNTIQIHKLSTKNYKYVSDQKNKQKYLLLHWRTANKKDFR